MHDASSVADLLANLPGRLIYSSRLAQRLRLSRSGLANWVKDNELRPIPVESVDGNKQQVFYVDDAEMARLREVKKARRQRVRAGKRPAARKVHTGKKKQANKTQKSRAKR